MVVVLGVRSERTALPRAEAFPGRVGVVMSGPARRRSSLACLGVLVLLDLAALLGGCAPRVVRTEGPPLRPAAPRDAGGWSYFVGEGRAKSPGRALELAETDARRQALESVWVEVSSDIRRRIQGRSLDGLIALDERAEAEIRSRSQGAIQGSRRHGEPYLEFYSDGAVLARVEVAFPKRSLDAAALFEDMVRRQASEHLLGGRLEKARDAFFTLAQLRPADPFPYLHLARIAEERGERALALEHVKRSRDLNGGKPWLELPPDPSGRTERVDLEREIDRLTPHWENLLAELGRLEEKRRDRESFRIDCGSPRLSRSQDAAVRFRLYSRELRRVALVWIDDDGLYVLPPPEGFRALGGPFFECEGSHLIEQELGTLNGSVRLVALSASLAGAEKAHLEAVERQALEEREPGAVEAEDLFTRFLEAESKAGSLEIAWAIFEVVP